MICFKEIPNQFKYNEMSTKWGQTTECFQLLRAYSEDDIRLMLLLTLIEMVINYSIYEKMERVILMRSYNNTFRKYCGLCHHVFFQSRINHYLRTWAHFTFTFPFTKVYNLITPLSYETSLHSFAFFFYVLNLIKNQHISHLIFQVPYILFAEYCSSCLRKDKAKAFFLVLSQSLQSNPLHCHLLSNPTYNTNNGATTSPLRSLDKWSTNQRCNGQPGSPAPARSPEPDPHPHPLHLEIHILQIQLGTTSL